MFTFILHDSGATFVGDVVTQQASRFEQQNRCVWRTDARGLQAFYTVLRLVHTTFYRPLGLLEIRRESSPEPPWPQTGVECLTIILRVSK
jgi:hypothetical protein